MSAPESVAIEERVERVYNALEGDRSLHDYHERHEVASALILTVWNEDQAKALLPPRFLAAIENKVVVEVGAGIGMLAFVMARFARRVYAIEVDPAWTWVFVTELYRRKPAHLTWIFGRAEEMVGIIKADVAVICTRSGEREMCAVGEQLADHVVVVHEEEHP